MAVIIGRQFRAGKAFLSLKVFSYTWPRFRSAMSMLVFYINRAGRNLDKNQLNILEQAKEELRILYGKNRLK